MNDIPIFVINLDRRTDRLKEMQSRLEGIAFSRISAVDGTHLIPSKKELSMLNDGAYPMSINELACIKSHLSVCDKIVDNALAFACVLEDDVILSPDFTNFIKDDFWVPKSAGVVKIETMKEKVWLSRRSIPALDRELHNLFSFHAGAAGYIISLDAAMRLQKLFRAPDQAADDLIFKRAVDSSELGDILQMVPALCVQEFIHSKDCSESDLLSGRESLRLSVRQKPKGLNKIIRELQRPFTQIWHKKRCFTERNSLVDFK